MPQLFIPKKTGKTGKKVPKSGTRRLARQKEWREAMRRIDFEIRDRNKANAPEAHP